MDKPAQPPISELQQRLINMQLQHQGAMAVLTAAREKVVVIEAEIGQLVAQIQKQQEKPQEKPEGGNTEESATELPVES